MECFLFVYGSQIAMALIEGMCTSIMQTYFVLVKQSSMLISSPWK